MAARLCLAPTPLLAHDAFGDLGPFYASLLHPLADPLQAALLVGTAAFVAGRTLSFARIALPLFAVVASISAFALAAGAQAAMPPFVSIIAVLVVGAFAMLPTAWTPRAAALPLVSAMGLLTGLAPAAPPGEDALQMSLGTAAGIAAFATLSWFGLEAAARRLTSIAPQVAGSWVAAVGILVVAFSI